MADPVFLCDGELGHGLSVLRKNKKGIISKPFLPHRFESNPSPAHPFRYHLSVIWKDKGHDAFEPRSSFGPWDPI